MFIAFPVVSALALMGSAQGLSIAPRSDPPPANGADFQCKPGFELTSYSSAGVSTCTRVEGSSIATGYSGQTVVYVGLLSGLTGLLVSCFPLARFFYQSGTGYFRNSGGSNWQNSFPRALPSAGADSAVDYDDMAQHLHAAWAGAHQQLQDASHDPSSYIAFHTSANSTAATYTHSGYAHTHSFDIVPHNETHSTFASHYEVTRLTTGDANEKRTNSFTGARITLNNVPVAGAYNGISVSSGDSKYIAENMILQYLNSVNGDPGLDQLCGYIASAYTPGHSFTRWVGEVTIASQVGQGGAFESSVCDYNWQDSVDSNDEL